MLPVIPSTTGPNRYISYSKHTRYSLPPYLLYAFRMQYGNWVRRMGNPIADCASTPPYGLLWCLKTCVAEAAACRAGEDQGFQGGGCLGQGTTAFLSHHSSPQGRRVQKGRVTAEIQLGFRASGQTWRSCALKSGNPKLPIALETGGKEMAHQTKQAPGLTVCLAWRQVHAHMEALFRSGGPNWV